MELLRGPVRRPTEDAGVGRERQRYLRQGVDPHPTGDGDRHHLDDLGRLLTDDVAT
jgi:hypothetical protein